MHFDIASLGEPALREDIADTSKVTVTTQAVAAKRNDPALEPSRKADEPGQVRRSGLR